MCNVRTMGSMCRCGPAASDEMASWLPGRPSSAQPNPSFQAQTSNCNISLKILPENLHKKNFPNNLKEDPWKAELILGLPRLLFTGIVGSREDSCVLGAAPPQPVELRRVLAGGLNGRDSRRQRGGRWKGSARTIPLYEIGQIGDNC